MRTALVVDDEADIRFLVAHVATKAGFEAVEAPSGVEALRLLAEGLTPDLVILDVAMPGLSGLVVCEKLRSDARWDGTPIVMLSAAARDSDQELGMRSGADVYVTKPFSPGHLAAVLRSAGELRAHVPA